MMQHKNHLPSLAQIDHVRRLVVIGLFGPTTVARLSGVSLWDVFRIKKAISIKIVSAPSIPTVTGIASEGPDSDGFDSITFQSPST